MVDDHVLLVDLLESYLGGLDSPIRVIKATSMPQALAIVEGGEDLALAVLDRHMPDMDGITGLKHLRRLRPELPVAILTGSPGASGIDAARRAGAVAYIHKTIGAPGIGQLLRRVLAGERYFPAPASPEFGGVSTPIRESRLGELGLSARERDVLSLLVAGLPNKDIARALSIATVTVSYHLTQIYRKRGVGSRTEAVRIAFERGLVSDRRG
jgi:DNA-binding NarL/FixJ family response regulator